MAYAPSSRQTSPRPTSFFSKSLMLALARSPCRARAHRENLLPNWKDVVHSFVGPNLDHISINGLSGRYWHLCLSSNAIPYSMLRMRFVDKQRMRSPASVSSKTPFLHPAHLHIDEPIAGAFGWTLLEDIYFNELSSVQQLLSELQGEP